MECGGVYWQTDIDTMMTLIFGMQGFANVSIVQALQNHKKNMLQTLWQRQLIHFFSLCIKEKT
jgi:hypothetical protein